MLDVVGAGAGLGAGGVVGGATVGLGLGAVVVGAVVGWAVCVVAAAFGAELVVFPAEGELAALLDFRDEGEGEGEPLAEGLADALVLAAPDDWLDELAEAPA